MHVFENVPVCVFSYGKNFNILYTKFSKMNFPVYSRSSYSHFPGARGGGQRQGEEPLSDSREFPLTMVTLVF